MLRSQECEPPIVAQVQHLVSPASASAQAQHGRTKINLGRQSAAVAGVATCRFYVLPKGSLLGGARGMTVLLDGYGMNPTNYNILRASEQLTD